MTGAELKRFAQRCDFSDLELAVALGYPRTKNSARLMRRYYGQRELPPGVVKRVEDVDTSDRHG